jgi:hypothetical protein
MPQSYLFFGSIRVTYDDSLQSFTDEHGFAPVVTGHMSGGVYAKGIAFAEYCYAVAFESPQSYGSSFTNDIDPHYTTPRTTNVYSDRSIFSMIEHDTIQNLHLPSYQSYIKPANPYETFCHIAAGCVMDDRYDHLCSSAVGEKMYLDYFEKWRRERGNLTSVGSPDYSMVQMAWRGT